MSRVMGSRWGRAEDNPKIMLFFASSPSVRLLAFNFPPLPLSTPFLPRPPSPPTTTPTPPAPPAHSGLAHPAAHPERIRPRPALAPHPHARLRAAIRQRTTPTGLHARWRPRSPYLFSPSQPTLCGISTAMKRSLGSGRVRCLLYYHSSPP